MKVLFISHSSVIFNYREKLRLLVHHKGMNLTLLIPKSWPEAGKRVHTFDQPENVEGFRIISAPIFFEGRIKRHFYPFFSSYIRQVKPDLIHIEEEPYSLAAGQAAYAAKTLGIPYIFFTWENLLQKFFFPHQYIRKFVLHTAAHAIAGDMEAAQLLEKANYTSSKITVLPQYGVNPKLFTKKNVNILRKTLGINSFVLGYVGRLVPEKGIQDLLEAFSRLKNNKAVLLIIGNGPLRALLEEKAVQLGINSRIRWIPALDQNHIPDYLNCMDVLVLPSHTTPTWKEQFGRVIIEAQACEVPVLGSDSGAIPEVIGKAGLIFKEKDIQDLHQKLLMLSQSLLVRKKLAKLGHQKVLKLYTNQIIADKTYRIYQNLLMPKKSSKS